MSSRRRWKHALRSSTSPSTSLQERLAEAGEEQAREVVEQAQDQGQQAQQLMSEASPTGTGRRTPEGI